MHSFDRGQGKVNDPALSRNHRLQAEGASLLDHFFGRHLREEDQLGFPVLPCTGRNP